jgi:hypothetical protein
VPPHARTVIGMSVGLAQPGRGPVAGQAIDVRPESSGTLSLRCVIRADDLALLGGRRSRGSNAEIAVGAGELVAEFPDLFGLLSDALVGQF